MYQNRNQNQNIINYNGFLQKYRVRKGNGDMLTHSRIGKPELGIWGGSYSIPYENYENFLDAYHKHRFINNNETYLTEVHSLDFAPILIDIDLRFKVTNGIIKRKYSQNDIITIIAIYTQVLSKYLHLTEDQLQAFVFEKTRPIEEKGRIKDGIHIMFPYISIPYNIQYIVRNEVINNDEIKSCFKNMGVINSIDDIIDKCVIESNNWLMYGACKPNKEHYQLTNVYICDPENSDEYDDVDISIYSDDRKLLSILSIYRTEGNASLKEGFDIKTIYNKLPNNHKSPCKNRSHRLKNKKNIDTSIVLNRCYEDEKFIDMLINCLSSERANNYDTWIKVGWCIHNIDYRWVNKWKKFSQKSDKYDPRECERLWDDMRSDGYGFKLQSLKIWAEEDNSSEFEKAVNYECGKLLEKCAQDPKSTIDIARYIHKRYKQDYVCASVSKKTWYYYNGHKWETTEEGVELFKLMGREISRQFHDVAEEYYQKERNADASDINKLSYPIMKENFKTIEKSLNRIGFRKNIFAECAVLFHNQNFAKNLDQNVDLIHFNNGVYDLKKFQFRDGCPEDMISISCDINYIGVGDLTLRQQDIFEEINVLLEQIFTNENVKNYALTFVASCLSGRISSEKFHIFTGSGSNGKSVFIDMIKNTLGNYWNKVETTLLTNKRRDAHAATPALAKLQGIRMVTLDEPEGDDHIKTGFMKELTGGDNITARHLNKDPITFKPQFKVVLICNDLPQVPSNDEGTWRRITVIPFTSKFLSKDKINSKKYENVPNKFLADSRVKDMVNSPEYAEVFMLILIGYYRKYIKYGLIEPDEVKVKTSAYKEECDNYYQFVNDHIIRDDRQSLKCRDAYKEFKTWYLEICGNKCPSMKEFRSAISRCLETKISRGDKWKGFTLSDEEYEEQLQDDKVDIIQVDNSDNSDNSDDSEEEADV